MEILILILHVVAALGIIGLVLLQHGKGADVGAAFGSGSAGSVFGSAGSANFLSRATAILAVFFFLTSMALTYFSTRSAPDAAGVMGDRSAPAQSLPAQIPAQAPGQKQAAPAPNESAPVPPVPSGAGKVQDVPK
jgi:preprotein translocase subunit SecG